MKLYGFWRSLATYRVRVALGLKGVAAQEISIDILKGKQFTDDYKKLNPQSVVPALVLDGGGHRCSSRWRSWSTSRRRIRNRRCCRRMRAGARGCGGCR